jgi:hypothetical protein
MKVHVSEGNTKLGKIPSVSLLPAFSCRQDVPCHVECYAQKAVRRRDCYLAWSENTWLAMNDLDSYLGQVLEYLRRDVEYFRWHVGGDILSQKYFEGMKEIAAACGWVKFLCFTKRYDLSYTPMPDNLQVVFSAWPGLPLVRDVAWRRVAWMQDGRENRLPSRYYECEGNCESCLKCFKKMATDVCFHKH